MANNSNSWKGFPYPIVKTSGGFFRAGSGAAQIKSDLLILLLTYPGERVMLPEFGTPLQDLIFEPGDKTLISQARQMIIKSITR
jgi:phage baseplate assembly protein W